MLFMLAAKAAITTQQKKPLEQLVRWLLHNEPTGVSMTLANRVPIIAQTKSIQESKTFLRIQKKNGNTCPNRDTNTERLEDNLPPAGHTLQSNTPFLTVLKRFTRLCPQWWRVLSLFTSGLPGDAASREAAGTVTLTCYCR